MKGAEKMMKNFYDSVRSERQLKSLTGLGKSKFEELLQAFEQALVEILVPKLCLGMPTFLATVLSKF